ncbi:MAG: hypothetical protein WC710_13515 [Gallionella sp.]|jgi:hypothetical protein
MTTADDIEFRSAKRALSSLRRERDVELDRATHYRDKWQEATRENERLRAKLACAAENECGAKDIEAERDELATVLTRYVSCYPAFRMKPMGAPNSSARIEQENLMSLEDAAREALASCSGVKP